MLSLSDRLCASWDPKIPQYQYTHYQVSTSIGHWTQYQQPQCHAAKISNSLFQNCRTDLFIATNVRIENWVSRSPARWQCDRALKCWKSINRQVDMKLDKEGRVHKDHGSEILQQSTRLFKLKITRIQLFPKITSQALRVNKAIFV